MTCRARVELLRPAAYALAAVLLSAVWGHLSAANQPPIASDHHPWARFGEGTSVEVQITTESLDADGNVTTTSTTRRKRTLLSVADDHISLRSEATVEVAGKRFEADPQTLKLGLYGEPFDDGVEHRTDDMMTGSVTIEGVNYPCRIEHFEATVQGAATVTKVYYSADVAPYILRTETTTTDPQSNAKLSGRTMEVVALGVPFPWQSGLIPVALRRSVHTHANGITKTFSWYSPEIPGGVAASSSSELNGEGRVVRRSWLEVRKTVIKQ